MSLKTEIQPYIDGNGLVAPNICTGQGRGSDNGVLFTSEYLIMLIRNKEAIPADIYAYITAVRRCMFVPGLLSRAPGDVDQEGPDDYYGVMAAVNEVHAYTKDPFILRNADLLVQDIFKYAIEHFGFMDNANPGKHELRAFIFRQLDLGAALLWVAGLPVGPMLRLSTALIIYLSCKNVPKTDTTSRLLAWLLVQTAMSHSWICRMAAKAWYKRLYNDFPGGMKDVATIYFQMGHPFAKYWVDKPL